MIEVRGTPNRSVGFITVSLLAALALATPVWAQEATLPGNASSLREVHGDWTVACALVSAPDVGKTRRCAFSQQQISQESRQRTLAIELRPKNEGIRGTLVLPFGLALENSITYQLDDGAEGSMLRSAPACRWLRCRGRI
ncbi:hypothetical protein [Pelagibacterium halotolerans]|uniref:hypothetical protein n=1 Tax=Pelagibacterium halotolerans TaxID=531813 RepID=UPI00384E7CFB